MNGYYMGDTFEARFGSGIGFIRNDPDGGRRALMACSASRISTVRWRDQRRRYVPIMPISNQVPSIFVSQEDVVWVDPSVQQLNPFTKALTSYSPVLPDLSLPSSPNAPSIDWRYSWMFTGYRGQLRVAGDVRGEHRDLREPAVRD